MQHINQLVIIILVVFLFTLSCEKEESKPAEIVGITVSTSPTKTSYYIGETIDLSGLIITLNIDNGHKKEIALADFSENELSCNPSHGSVVDIIISTIIITHGPTGKNTSLPITVNEIIPVEISIKTPPDKVDYFVNEAINLNGLEVILSLNNGTSKAVLFEDFVDEGLNCSIENGTILTKDVSEIVIYLVEPGLSISQPISVHTMKISVKTLPAKLEYNVGDILDLSSLEVTLTIDESINEDVVFEDFESRGIECDPPNSSTLTLASNIVTITHTVSGSTTKQKIKVFGSVSDSDGNSYAITQIGDQIWMAENLKTTKYNDGIEIPLVTEKDMWQTISTPAYCWYDNDEASYADLFGALYNFYTIETNKLCPVGWHVPTDKEWADLKDFIVKDGFSGNEGKVLKAKDSWNSNNGTDYYGFKALAAGYRDYINANDPFINAGNLTLWWSYVEGYYAQYIRLSCLNNGMYSREDEKNMGYSVRCIKD